MPTNTPDQQLTVPIGTDTADNPQAFLDYTADVETRLVLKYTDAVDRTARHTAPIEGDLTGLASENRYDVYDGANYVSLTSRSNHFFVRRTADGTVGNGAVNNSVALVNDPSLAGLVNSNATYMFDSTIWYDSSTVADIKFTITGPASTVARFNVQGLATTATANEGDVRIQTANFATSIQVGGIGVGTIVFAKIEGFISTTAPGTLQFQFAQQNLDATQTTIRNGSYLRCWRTV